MERVLGEAAVVGSFGLRTEVSEGNLRIEFRGQPNGTGTLETTTDPVNGPWEQVGPITMDEAGAATVTRALDSGEAMRFFRIRE